MMKKLLKFFLKRHSFSGSAHYWEERYQAGGHSGQGSYGRLQEFKRETLNHMISENSLSSAIEFGCGDGAQLEGIRWPRYTGLDVSCKAVELCRKKFESDSTKCFMTAGEYSGQKADASLSLDVLYHLVEDSVYEAYMARLFAAGERFVIIYSTDIDLDSGGDLHVRHRAFTDWISKNATSWGLVARIQNPYHPTDINRPLNGESAADFFIFRKLGA